LNTNISISDDFTGFPSLQAQRGNPCIPKEQPGLQQSLRLLTMMGLFRVPLEPVRNDEEEPAK
jgi:hypothetical protein